MSQHGGQTRETYNITIRCVEILLSFGRGLKEKLKENGSHLELHLRRRLTGRPYFG